MDIDAVTEVFMWCTIINGAMLVLWVAVCLLASNWMYRIHSKLFPMPRETHSVLIYAFLGLFKIAFLIFNVVPYVALEIVG